MVVGERPAISYVRGVRPPAPAPAPASSPEAKHARLPYLPGLDGLRALAVAAVVLYHANVRGFAGGFLGVEVFFVISGYLITALLLGEWERRGGIALRAFWGRRARRLLPAVYVLIVAVMTYVVIALPSEVAGLRLDALSSLTYVTNWYLVFSQKSYFEAIGRPSMFQHLWSLAVEEQFYLLWPIVLTAMLRFWRRRVAVIATVSGALASSLLMALLYRTEADPSRVYYGTDTRATGLLIGAALAFLWVPGRAGSRGDNKGDTGPGRGGSAQSIVRRMALNGNGHAPVTTPLPSGRRTQHAGPFADAPPWLLNAAGVAAFAAVIAFFVRADQFQPFIYRGGFLLLDVSTAVLIAVIIHPRAFLGTRLFNLPPLPWIGTRSYSIYLWHWPVLMLTRPQLDLPLDGVPLFALRIAISLALAEASYRFVETPIRGGAIGRAWRSLRTAAAPWRLRFGIQWASVAASGLIFVVVLGIAVAGAKPPPPPAYLTTTSVGTVAAGAQATAGRGPGTVQNVQPTVASAPTGVAGQVPTASSLSASSLPCPPSSAPCQTPTPPAPPTPTPGGGQPTPSGTPNPTRSVAASDATAAATVEPTLEPATEPAASSAPKYLAIGDSVMVGAGPALSAALGDIDIEASVGLQAPAAVEILRARKAAGEIGDVVIIHIGDNGYFPQKNFDEMMEIIGPQRRAIVVNVKVPRQWEGPNNEMLAANVKRYPNATLVDWRAASINRPEIFWDGIHLRPEGATLYTDLIVAAIKGG